MAFITKFDDKGELLVSIQPGSNTLLLNKTKRIIGDFPIEILHFFNPDRGWAVWALNRIRTSMLTDQGEGGRSFYCASKSNGTPKPVQYLKPVYMYAHRAMTCEGVMLCDRSGNVLAGSNIYDPGFGDAKAHTLCLGSHWQGMTLEPVDLMLYNNANRDLSWRGDELMGKWIQAENNGSKIKVFEIDTWPHFHKRYDIPAEVLATVDSLWTPSI